MKPDFWLARWQHNQIGFHQTKAERNLESLWGSLRLAEGSRVFVPLCGKSLDLLWLRDRGYDVIGAEISEIAVEAFCMENGLSARRHAVAKFDRYATPALDLLCGDFFELTAAVLGNVAAIYDRAALISWAPELRTPYVEHLTSITNHGTSIFLIVLEFIDQHIIGPPFPIEPREIDRLYSSHYSIRELARRDVSAEEPKLRARGIPQVVEVCYHMIRTH